MNTYVFLSDQYIYRRSAGCLYVTEDKDGTLRAYDIEGIVESLREQSEHDNNSGRPILEDFEVIVPATVQESLEEV